MSTTTPNPYSSHQGYKTVPNTESMNDSNMDQNLDTSSNAITSSGALPYVPDDSDRSSVGGGLPSTYSSQQLMPVSAHERMGGGIDTLNSPANHQVNRSQWFTIGVLCFVNLINYMDRFTIAGVLTDIQDEFNIGDDKGGLLQTVFVISYMFCAPIFGYLGDRYSRPLIMVVGVSLWSTTTLIGSFMNHYGSFLAFRALVGIGEASYSTIAPTIISDLFIHDMRSRMLAIFYFAIPVGSGCGYIVGSETARLASDWRWALRVTPFLGVIAVALILLIKDPERGESEGSVHLQPTTYCEDIKDLVRNRSFMLSTAGFTCVTFVTGALAWWGPKFIYLGLRLQAGYEDITLSSVSYKFGIIAMLAGVIGVPLGSYFAQRFRPTIENCDPYVCAFGLLVSAPLIYFALIMPQKSAFICYMCVFLAQVALNQCWSIVTDILLYVVVPTRRSTAEAFQILISHALGDAGSPYFVGVLSEAIKNSLRNNVYNSVDSSEKSLESFSLTLETESHNSTVILPSPFMEVGQHINRIDFEGLQYSLFSTSFVEALGGVFFLITAVYIVRDKRRAWRLAREGYNSSHTITSIN